MGFIGLIGKSRHRRSKNKEIVKKRVSKPWKTLRVSTPGLSFKKRGDNEETCLETLENALSFDTWSVIMTDTRQLLI
jgi:hypothetical protein